MDRLDSIREILRRGIARRAFPGAAVAIGDQNRIEVVCEGWHAYVAGQSSPLLRPQDSASGSLGGGGEGLGERFSAELPNQFPSPGTGEGQGGGADLQKSGDPDAGGTPAGQSSPLLRPEDLANTELGGGGEGLGERFSAELPNQFPSPDTGEGQGGGAGLQSSGDPDAGGTPAVQFHTLYDLASLTKILATTHAAMVLDIDPELPASTWLHEWQGGEKAKITIRQLLDHTAGLPAFRRYEEQTLDANEVARLIVAEPLEAEPGTRTVYSDLGPILVGMILERIEPGALRRYGEGPGLTFCPSPDQYKQCPPAEPVEQWRARMWDERGLVARPSVEIDGVEYVRGEVHDPRAALLGGVAGHAGLFGTAEGVARRLQGWLRSHQAGDPILRKWTEPSSPGRGLGFDLDPGSEIHLSPGAFGHYGFTGTMAWVEPARDRFIVMLSNRIHPSASNLGHREVRSELFAWLDLSE